MAPSDLLLWLFFLYTPIPQFFILYFLFYRHELSRIVRPVREKGDFKTFVNAFVRVGLVDDSIDVKSDRPLLRYLERLFAVTAAVSLFCSLLLWPALMVSYSVLTRFGLELLFLLQFAPASYSLVYLRKNYLGPVPLHRLRSIISPVRQSSLVRHLNDNKNVAGGRARRAGSTGEGRKKGDAAFECGGITS